MPPSIPFAQPHPPTFHITSRFQSRLLSLPPELLFKIFEHTEIHEFAPLAGSCRYMYHLASELMDERKELGMMWKYYPCEPAANSMYRRAGPYTVWVCHSRLRFPTPDL
jgi:hypothetical protein